MAAPSSPSTISFCSNRTLFLHARLSINANNSSSLRLTTLPYPKVVLELGLPSGFGPGSSSLNSFSPLRSSYGSRMLKDRKNSMITRVSIASGIAEDSVKTSRSTEEVGAISEKGESISKGKRDTHSESYKPDDKIHSHDESYNTVTNSLEEGFINVNVKVPSEKEVKPTIAKAYSYSVVGEKKKNSNRRQKMESIEQEEPWFKYANKEKVPV